jgi:uncharacterized protein
MGNIMKTKHLLALCLLKCLIAIPFLLLIASSGTTQATRINTKDRYLKTEYQVPMRDGKKLYTIVYTPRDVSQKYPILMQRSPYGAQPYGGDAYRASLGPSPAFMEEGYIFVYQDVRGTFMSEGEFEDMRPFIPAKKGKNDIDESSDTNDTIDWLLKNIPRNNGRVGLWGISYPGFYTAAALMDPHPAIKAASPQAPIADWFIGDDDHHNGAFFLFDCFSFNMVFGMPRPQPTPNQFKSFDMGTTDAYRFFLELGPLANAQKQYFKGKNKYWNDVTTHDTYDEFWQARNVLPHLTKVTPAVMVVGGWYDAENLFGALNIYQAIEKNNPKTKNILIMGPWSHGGWARGPGDSLGNIRFDSKTAEWYRDNLEFPFFNFYLKDKGELKAAEATVFQTGTNQWKTYEQWPPKETVVRNLYFHQGGRLSFDPPGVGGNKEGAEYDEYLSDPANPVPYSNEITKTRGNGYMIEDQRFAARRSDVRVYQTDPLREDLTLAGPAIADLWVSTTGSDADFIVKLIDVFPDQSPHNVPQGANHKMGGFQMLVRAEVMRGKFRNSYTKPEPFTPNKPAEVKFRLQDLQHTFKAGHRVMVQVQSSWFPLIDRNPQKFIDIFQAKESDFQKARHRIYTSPKLDSQVKVGVLK